jgi:hypothetical protein
VSTEIIVNTVITLFSAAVGFSAAWVVMLYQFREAKRQLCIEMYQEYDQVDMLQSRFEAGDLLKEASQVKMPVLLEELYDNAESRTRYIQLARVLRFWERLSVMIDSQRVDISLAREIFAYDYRSWSENYLSLCESDRYPIIGRVRRLDEMLLREKTR